MYIPELLDLSDHCSHRRVPHHLKFISSQGFWMIMIGCRTDGDLKAGGWVFLIFWYSKKGICYDFCDTFATRPPFPWDPFITCPTLQTLLNLTLTPHFRHTHIYHHLVAVVSVDLKMYTFRPTFLSIDWPIGLWTEKPGDRYAFQRTRIDGWNKCQLPHQLITWPIYQHRRGDAYQRTQIDGWRGRAVYISNQRHQYSPIDWSINQLIYQQTD